MSAENFQIIDITLPINSETACFPGDTPFSRDIVLSYRDSQVINLSKFSMSPHVGTHADAPVHIHGDMARDSDTVGNMLLSPFVGPVAVVDIAPYDKEISLSTVKSKLDSLETLPARVLFKTAAKIRYKVFEDSYAYFSVGLVEFLASQGVVLVGIDTPSVDHITSKSLPAHNALTTGKMTWLENLDLTSVSQGHYFLIALPLKFTELEASPVRAVLLAAK